METARNVPTVLVQTMRASAAIIRRLEWRVDDGARADRRNAMDCLETALDELEAWLAAPDPAGARACP